MSSQEKTKQLGIIKFGGYLARAYIFYPAGLQGNRFQLLSPETFTLNVEYSGIVKDTIQGAEQGIIFIEISSPQRWILVAGKDNVKVAFLVVAAVNQIKEQPGVLLVEFTVAYLINNQAGGSY